MLAGRLGCFRNRVLRLALRADEENLAAALLIRSGWPRIAAEGGALADPMCGVGTFLIEAALMAADVAPNLRREHWGFSDWLGHVPALWESLLSEAQARALLPGLCDLGVELVEQPLARGQLPALAELRRTSPLPLYADEDVQGPESLAALRGCVDGINIKLMKCGGISPALEMIALARREGWRVLLGCMIESRVGLAAAASLAAHVDELDLDAHLLTADDPVPPGSARVLTATPPLVPGAGLGVPLRW